MTDDVAAHVMAGAPVAACPASVMHPMDLIDTRIYRDGRAQDVWRELRRHAPVSWHAVGDSGYWSVTRHHDAELVLRDYATFTSERGTLLNLLGRGDPAGGRQMAATDPPRHTRMREPIQRALSIRTVDNDRDRIRQIVLDLLGPLGEGEVVDFAATMAMLPMAVIGSMMGVPRRDWPRLVHLTTSSIAAEDPSFRLPAGTEATLAAAHRELFAYFQDVAAERQRKPASEDDLISVLLSMELDGRRLVISEIVANCYSLLLGANVTTAQPPNAALVELTGTGVWDDWAAHPQVVTAGVEEALRWASPTQHFMRHATRDVEIRGTPIRAGDAVVVWLASANRDEDVFSDPFTFDIRRHPNKHVAFGVGPHYCIGHTVARVTLRVLFAELVSRFTDFELAGPPERLQSNVIAGFKHLPVRARRRPVPLPVGY